MAEVVIKFKLPEEEYEFKTCVQAVAMRAAITDFHTHLLRKYKHVDPSSDDAFREFEELQKNFYDTLDVYNIEL